ncbi:MAG: hypothetical protein IJJ74_06595 [Eubacterium sp.]|nr:hypothetical protein [Eubacterium sp.]MBR1675363.1 hypothetical protein [Eubacterium sp.]
MNKHCIGDKDVFAIEYEFFDAEHITELSVFVNGDNILAFIRDGEEYTTCWNLDDIAEWLRSFIDNMSEDPYPISTEGKYAAEKDINAREYDTDDDEEFDKYYDALDEWCLRHRWHPYASGGILSDVYFQLVGDNVEISWNNTDMEDYIIYKHKLGGGSVERKIFYNVVDSFLKEYAIHWFN